MEAGTLDRRVQFRRFTLTDDGFAQVEAFGDLGSPVWASKTDVSDGERYRANEVSASVTARFVVRYSPFTASITPADRMVCAGREYDITNIKEIGRREGLEMTASARGD
jgi:SPP1 family predicted phage head-tail adaptor